MKAVIFSSALSPSERRIYKAVTLLLIAVFFAFMWPIYPIFNRIRPLTLGMPASLFYLVFLVGVSFATILALYLWEDRHGKLEEPKEPAASVRSGQPPRKSEPTSVGNPEPRGT